MKKLLIFLLLIMISCEKERYCYSFDVWVSDTGLIRIDYFADIGGYTLLLGCEPNLTTQTAQEVRYEPLRMSGGYAFTRTCTPTYVRVISSAGDEERRI